jgi:hypothetical protein
MKIFIINVLYGARCDQPEFIIATVKQNIRNEKSLRMF